MKGIYSIVQELRSNNSRLFKESVLESQKENDVLKWTFKLALDPLTQFHIRKIPAYTPSSQQDLPWAFYQLGKLSRRELTGHAGIAHLKQVLSSLYEDDAKIIELIIAKDLDCGVSVETVNKTWPGLISKFPYMRCSQFKDIKKAKINWKSGIYSQIKSDGMYASISVRNDGVEISTRGGRLFDSDQFSGIVNEIKDRVGFQYHGELLVEEDGVILERKTGNGVLTSVLKGGSFGLNQQPVFVCWDVIPLEKAVPGGEYAESYSIRFRNVGVAFSGCEHIKVAENRMVYSLEEAMDHYEELLSQGHEGSIIKCPDAIWEHGTSKKQFKVKVDFNVDLKVISVKPGNGKNAATFGSLRCASGDDLLEVSVSGMSDKLRKEIHELGDKIIDKIVEVKSNCIMKPKKEGGKYSLFLPRFVEIRDDKEVADTLPQIFDQFESIVKDK
jgi:DNA ligase-1